MVWKSKQRMHEMFVKGKLCRGAVPSLTLPTTSKLQTSSESKETVDCLVRKLPREQLPASPGLEIEGKVFPKSGKTQHELTKQFYEEICIPKCSENAGGENAQGSAISRNICAQPIKSVNVKPTFGHSQQQERRDWRETSQPKRSPYNFCDDFLLQ